MAGLQELRENDFQALILQYLRQKGYGEAERAFTREAAVNQYFGEMVKERIDVHRTVVAQLLRHYAAEGDPRTYTEGFDRLVTWVDNSLDLYRAELGRVLYPVFMQCYLQLVARDAGQLASAMWHRYKRRLEHSGGRQARSRAQELQQLQSIAVKQHLETSGFAKQLAQRRHPVRMTTYSYDLLMHFLHTAPGMVAISNIVGQRIKFEVVEGRPDPTADDAGARVGALALDDDDASAATNLYHQPTLGLLQGDLEEDHQNKLEEAELKRIKDEAAKKETEEVTGGLDPTSKKKAKALAKQQAAIKASVRLEATPLQTKRQREPQTERKPFMPPLPEELQMQWQEDIAARHKVSPSELPSCCFLTFVNTKQSLASAAFTRDARFVAGGFADSSVRLYDLQAMAAAAAAAGPMDMDDAMPGASGVDGLTQHGMTHFYGHMGCVHGVDFTPDMRLVLSASADGTVRMWSTELGAALCAMRASTAPLWDVEASPVGYLFATGGADRAGRIWATDSARAVRLLAGHQADVDVVRWHPNGAYLATGSSDRTVRLWDVATGYSVRLLSGQAVPTSLAFSPDGRQVAVGADNGTIAVWDLGSARRLATLQGHVGPVWSLSFTHGLGPGGLLASGGADETVRLWSAEFSASTPAPAGGAAANAGPGAAAGGKQQQAAAAAAQQQEQQRSALRTFRTKSSPVVGLAFTGRNLLMAAGAFNLRGAGPVGGAGAAAGAAGVKRTL